MDMKKQQKGLPAQAGQALLLVLLAMAVLATMALSVVSRSISEVSVTTREEESLRAFSAAEAGVEEGLITGTPQEVATATTPIPISRDLEVTAPSGTSVVSSFNAGVERYPLNLQAYIYPFELLSGQAASVSFVTRDEDGDILPCGGSAPCFGGNSLTLCWGDPDNTSQTPAVVANIIFRDGSGNFGTASTGFDPDSTRRGVVGFGGAPPNNFNAPTGGSCPITEQSYSYTTNIDFAGLGITGTPVLMRVAMFYNDTEPHIFGISTTSNLPVQGRRVSSEGVAGEVTRQIDAFLLNPEMPFIFDAALYSSGDIAK
ncbi:hypothetical protein A2803_03055 [Candidatus Woesebacteria bacterium RIFCSPHIGHO2_01_FULL_44_21]|uniref:Type 4 fimbrial biogenesis protein PilX N-terminal domain-containing protein n=1 Tax=Candidatus Woesebacteria bacterium RIFCSPHIGHO2_01_FULL_44_21 TaxID=1802503 RepID=A0A1F7Z0I1_9BACT|nr:MAG: hypothetical protein A2803_03055 [Candidatus Woesebacteria bacterium RIFCSPHIGHO2_01_FULL_44_21]OGM69206.1 MAG: hypothetical protein A2897_04325 [Candidatus Woesebacteria bacterium RIFCSPLOWO2_01_FULL_44_24b]